MTLQPLVSIITPVYRACLTLPECAVSVFGQTIEQFEWLLVVDDDEEHRYRALPALADARVRWFSTGGIARGPSFARNIALNSARGQFFCHLDADDLMCCDRLERLLPLAARHGVATDNHEVFEGQTGQRLGYCLPSDVPAWVSPELAMSFNLPFFPLYHSRLAVRWEEDVRFSEDVLFNLRLISNNGGMAVDHQGLLRYRTHSGSTCNKMPDGYFLARDGYNKILEKLSAGADLGLRGAMQQQLSGMFERKKALNEQFWGAYRAGQCGCFNEFISMCHAPAELAHSS